ncbi:Cytochrome P450 4c3 [Orchesella cincta]|uniref:Cytochrome P450 4c3 n=1 Tax=Orchesella cincta TaxID=48709 RepID=A0A1D2MAD2_ORCCI|nr:Cytochrome P450 4c3 [Orchesella cincta]
MEVIIESNLHNLTIDQHENLRLDRGADYLITLALLVVLQFVGKRVSQKRRKCDSDSEKERVFGLDIIPGPKPFFISFIGNAYNFLPIQETLNKIMLWHKIYGPCMKVIGVNHTGLVVYSAEIAQSFLKSGDLGHVSKENMPFYDIMRPFLGNGILIAEGQHWRNRRKLLMKSMSFQSLRSYTKILNKHSKRFVTTLENLFQDNVEHPINVPINCSFLAIITEILTGSDIKNVHEVAEYHHNFQTWKQCLITRIEKLWCLLDSLWIFHPKYKIHNEAVANMNSFAKRRLRELKLRRQSQIKERNEDESYSNSDPEDYDKFRSILDELVDAGVSDAELVYELNTLLFGGHETTATTIHFFFFLMALHPQHQESCRREIDQVFDDPLQAPDENLTFEALANLKYVERCLFETMRLYPSVFAFMRYLKNSLIIVYKGKQVEVPAGTDIIIAPWVIHRNPDYYPNPEEFDPDRFLPEECAKRHPCAYLPFSAGPRNCIGDQSLIYYDFYGSS